MTYCMLHDEDVARLLSMRDVLRKIEAAFWEKKAHSSRLRAFRCRSQRACWCLPLAQPHSENK
jgi:hypothetical protein